MKLIGASSLITIFLIISYTITCMGVHENDATQAITPSGYTKDSLLAGQYIELADSFKLELQYADAINSYLKAGAIFEKYQKWEKYTSTYNHIAKYYSLNKQYHKAKEYATLALETGLDKLPPHHLNIAISYSELMSFYYDYGQDYQTAIMYGRKALNLCLQNKPDRRLRMVQSDIYHQMGITFCTQGMYDSAYTSYKKALHLLKQLYKEKPTSYGRYIIGGIHASLAFYFRDIKQYDSSLVHHKQAILCYEAYEGKWSKHSLSATYMILSGTYRKLHDYKSSISYARKGLEINLDLFGPDHPETALAYRSLGIAYREDRQYSAALKQFQKVLIIRANNFADTSVYRNPDLEDYKNDYKALQGLISKAICLKKMYEFNTGDIKDLQFSLSTALDGIALLDKMREELVFKESNKGLMKMMWFCYELSQSISHQLYRITGKEKYIDLAFNTAEKSKAFMLWQSIGVKEALSYNEVPEAILNKEVMLINAITGFKENLFVAQKNRNIELVQTFNDSLLMYKEEQQRLIRLLKHDYPEYYKFRYDKSVASIPEIQKTLDDNSLVLSYFEGDSALYIFNISKNKAGFTKIENVTEISSLVSQLKQELTTLPGTDKKGKSEKYRTFTESSYQLFEKLVLPFLTDMAGSVNRLTIIPDGALSHIPFEVLLTAAPDPLMQKSVNYRDLSYLMQEYAISYNHSATLQIYHVGRTKSKNNGKCLALAPVYQGESNPKKIAMRGSMHNLREQPLEALPGAQKEVKGISNFFDGIFLLGNEATESNFKQEAGEYAIIHLAMHGKSDVANDQYSKLVFTPTGKQEEDDTLFTYELYNMHLNADLVVLSACETGKGNYVRGEGVMSPARGFMQAGSPSVVQTLWESADQASTSIITYFYEGLSQGMEKDKALQEARLRYIRENRMNLYSHPFYWAGFVLAGNNRPLSITSTFSYAWVIIASGMIFAVMLILLVIKIKKQKELRLS